MKILKLFAALVAFSAAGLVNAADRAIVVFDASGSMWGQIDGQSKIAIAKQTLSQLVRDWDEATELGLTVYGHRRKGDCSDIESLVPVGPVNRQLLLSKVAGINPKGKTPISASLRQAANELRYTEDSATVILISDGKETCNADPCAAAAELEKLGVNFTAHVIGFDVDDVTRAQLQCIAGNTGGMYLDARDASQLTEAVRKVVEQPKTLVLQARDSKTGQWIAGQVVWRLINQSSEEVIEVQGAGSGSALYLQGKVSPPENTVSIAPGSWLVTASIGDYAGQVVAGIKPELDQQLVLDLERQLPKVEITAPDEAVKATAIEIGWTSDKQPLDALIVLEKAGAPWSQTGIARLGALQGSPQTMQLPAETGNYVLRAQKGNEIYAEKPLKIINVPIKLIAPEESVGGVVLEIGIEAPDGIEAQMGGRMQVVVPERPGVKAKEVSYYHMDWKRPIAMRLPAMAGDYEIRWQSKKRELLASKPIRITEPKVALKGPAEAVGGTVVNLEVDAPEGLEEQLLGKVRLMTIPQPGLKAKEISYYYMKWNRPIALRMPSKPGDYEFVWRSEKGDELTKLPIRVTEPTVELQAPDEAVGGTVAIVTIDAPEGLEEQIAGKMRLMTLPQPGVQSKEISYYYMKWDRPIALRLPNQSGEYEIRWESEKREVLARRNIRVTEATVGLKVPDQLIGATVLEVGIDAPEGLEEQLKGRISLRTIPGAPGIKPKEISHYYMSWKRPIWLRLPAATGTYELVWNSEKKDQLAKASVKVVAPELSINSPGEVVAGNEFFPEIVAGEGMRERIKGKLVLVNMAAPGTRSKEHSHFYMSWNGAPKLKAPKAPGSYEIRWLSELKEVLASAPVTVKSE